MNRLLCSLLGAATYPNFVLGWVDVEDVAKAHILAYESASASGRYLCVGRVAHYSEIVELLKNLYPQFLIRAKYGFFNYIRYPCYAP